MLKITIKTLVLCLFGISLLVSTQGGDGKHKDNEDDLSHIPIKTLKLGDNVRDENEAMLIDIESILRNTESILNNPYGGTPINHNSTEDFQSTQGEDVFLQHSVLQISCEYLLYEYEDPALYNALQVGEEEALIKKARDASIKRAKEESTRNKAYSLTTPKRSFSVQPGINGLKNELGPEVDEWQKRRDSEYASYDLALIELQKREGYQRSDPSLYNAMRLRRAQQAFRVFLKKFVRAHGPKEVMLGEREATEEEIIAIQHHITAKKPKIIITPKGYFFSTLSIGTTYGGKSEEPKVQGFRIELLDCSYADERLKRLVESLKRENPILTKVSVDYKDSFLKQVSGWALWQLANWTYLSGPIATAQTQIKAYVDQHYPFPLLSTQWRRDRTTDTGEVLACLNKDECGQELKKRWFAKIITINNELYSLDDSQGGDTSDRFSKIYSGEDKLESLSTEEGCHIPVDFPFSNPIKVEFSKIKQRQFISDEERYTLYSMAEDPSDEELNSIRENEVGLYLKDDEVRYKVQGKDAVVMQESDLTQRLKIAMQGNREPDPKGRRLFLNLILDSKYISRKQETFLLRPGIQMVQEYPSLAYVVAHKKIWSTVMEQLPKKRYQPTNPHKQMVNHHKLWDEYRDLLPKNTGLLWDLYLPYTSRSGGYRTRIPRGWKFFINEAYQKPTASITTSPDNITLNNVSIRDEDMQKKRLTPNGCAYMFECYQAIDLSNNFLTGTVDCHFSQFITTLTLRNNQISSLNFLSDLTALKVLDLSGNHLSDLSAFSKFVSASSQGCISLQQLNLSHNEIEDVSPLFDLNLLEELDLSNNKIQILSEFCQSQTGTCLLSLKVNNNKLKGEWKTVLNQGKGLALLTTLELKGNKQLITEGIKDDVMAFPNLKTLRTDEGGDEQLAEQQ